MYQIDQTMAEILNEIFLTPSKEIKTERFLEGTTQADCSGKCQSGVCRT